MAKLYTEIIALCEYATIAQDGKLSIQGIFDELSGDQLPARVARAFLVATIHGLPNHPYNLTLKAESENSKSSLQPLQLKTVTSPNGKNNLIVELLNLNFQEAGDYRFVIYNEGEEVGSTTLKVILLNQYEKIAVKKSN